MVKFRKGRWLLLGESVNKSACEWVRRTGLSSQGFAKRGDAIKALKGCLSVEEPPGHPEYPAAIMIGGGTYLLSGGLAARRGAGRERWVMTHPDFSLHLGADSLWHCCRIAFNMDTGRLGYSSIKDHLEAIRER
jgi:hypothetical protein